MNWKSSLICLALCSAGCIESRAQSSFEDGLKPEQLAKVSQVLPSNLISSVRLFHEKTNSRLSAAFLTQQRGKGWQLLLVSPRGHSEYRIGWQSPVLSDGFAVSSPEQLRIYGLEDGDAIAFSGCAPHMCPDVFSVLLYVPSYRRTFTATCDGGKTSYSFPLTEANLKYKGLLDELLRGKSGSDSACSPDIMERR